MADKAVPIADDYAAINRAMREQTPPAPMPYHGFCHHCDDAGWKPMIQINGIKTMMECVYCHNPKRRPRP